MNRLKGIACTVKSLNLIQNKSAATTDTIARISMGRKVLLLGETIG